MTISTKESEGGTAMGGEMWTRSHYEGDRVVVTTGPVPIGVRSGDVRTACLQERADALAVRHAFGYELCLTERKNRDPRTMLIIDQLKSSPEEPGS